MKPDDVFTDLVRRYPDLSDIREELAAALVLLTNTLRGGGKLLLAGNGGSASDADHFAAELLKSFCAQRPCPGDEAERYGPALANALQGGLPAIPLTSFPALQTAWANDCDAAYVFAQLVHVLGRKGDALVLFTTSGNSTNLLHAARVARARGLAVLALTGPTGGQLRDLVDIAIRTPGESVYAIQERHLPIYHAIARALERTFFPEATAEHGSSARRH